MTKTIVVAAMLVAAPAAQAQYARPQLRANTWDQEIAYANALRQQQATDRAAQQYFEDQSYATRQQDAQSVIDRAVARNRQMEQDRRAANSTWLQPPRD